MRILLAVDGSDYSEAAVDEIVLQHFPAKSEVRIISAVEPPSFPGTFPGENVSVSLVVLGVTKAGALLCTGILVLIAIWLQIATIHHMLLEKRG